MANCNWRHGKGCDNTATTTLTCNDGVVRQLCEEHRDEAIRIVRNLADQGVPEADHWFVLNKIPS